jgi:hypothetical protein
MKNGKPGAPSPEPPQKGKDKGTQATEEARPPQKKKRK